jgi:Tol biopolymer transport system component
VISFAGGSVFLSRDHSPPGPPGYGTWSANGNRFVFTFLTSGGGGPQTFLATISGKGKRDGNQISGTYTVAATDGNGANPFNDSGTFTGTRIAPGG